MIVVLRAVRICAKLHGVPKRLVIQVQIIRSRVIKHKKRALYVKVAAFFLLFSLLCTVLDGAVDRMLLDRPVPVGRKFLGNIA